MPPRYVETKTYRTTVYCRTIVFFCVDASGYAKQRNFSSVVLKINNDQEESVSSAVYKYDTSTNVAFFNLPDSIAKDINVGKFIIKKFFFYTIITYKSH